MSRASSLAEEARFTLYTPFSNLLIVHDQTHITKIQFIVEKPSDNVAKRLPFERKIAQEISRYLTDPTFRFSIPLTPRGTPFQKKVWNALQSIEPGAPITYGDLAKKLKSCAQAIGQACRHNPIPIIIPCHRIIAKNHQGGYAGATKGKLFQIKQWLLTHEG